MLGQLVSAIRAVRPLRLIACARDAECGLDGQLQFLLDELFSAVSVVHQSSPREVQTLMATKIKRGMPINATAYRNELMI